MVNPLSRDYWPAETRSVLGRVILGFVVSPLVVVAIAMAVLLVAEWTFVSDFTFAESRALSFAPIVLAGTYVILLSAGFVAFLLLWALRLRRRSAYAAAGMAIGLVCALAAPYFGTARVGIVPVIIFAVHFGVLMLVFRAIAGVRNLNGRS